MVLLKITFATMILFTCCSNAARGDVSYSGARFISEPPCKAEFMNTKSMTINCLATGNPLPKINWTLIDGSPVTGVTRLLEIHEDSLVFNSFKAENFRPDVHSAVYRCIASNLAGIVHSCDVNVRGIVSQTHEILVYDSYAIEGNSAVFKCHVPVIIKDYITVTAWIKNDNLLIQPSTAEVVNGKFAVMPSGELHIHNVTLGQSGSRFKCKATHRLTGEVQISSSDGQLFITEARGLIAPKILESPASVSVTVGQSAVLECVSQGNPLPSVQWFKKNVTDNRLMPVNFGKRFVKTNGAMIIEMSSASDSGIYVCEATSDLGKEVINIKLTVSELVTVNIEPSNSKTKIGEKVNMKCVTSGKIVSVLWLHNGSPVKTSSGNTLIIESVQMADRGMYQCFVIDETGYSLQATSELQLSEITPQFVEIFNETVIQPGGSLTLRCSAIGVPLPNISWTIDGMPVNTSSNLQIDSFVGNGGSAVGIIKFNKVVVKDGGFYACIALSDVGEATHSARLNVYGGLGIRLVPQVFAVSGRNMFLNCPFYGYPVKEVTWFKDKRPLHFSRRLNPLTNGTLIAEEVDRKRDGGIYNCLVHDDNGDTIEAELNVSVLVAPKIVPFEFQDELLREGMRARLQCVISNGDLPLSVSWLKDGKPLPLELGVLVRILDEFSSILTINSITPGHNGKYTCVASNRAATVTHTAELSVNVAPKIVPFTFQEEHVFEGALARLTCVVYQGDLPLKIIWLKDDVPISEVSAVGVSVRNVDTYTSILTIDHVVSSHGGNYSCVANNQAASASHTATLVVNVPPKLVPFSFQDEHLAEGQLARVSCIVSRGDLPLTLIWEKDGNPINESAMILIKSFDEYSTILSITAVSPVHNGLYTCVASNAAGSIRHSAKLTVNVPPQWIHEPEDVSLLKGESVVLHCSVRGFPQPNISWMKVSGRTFTPLKSGPNRQLFSNGTLHLNNIDSNDEGHYYCEASNGIGTELNKRVQVKIHVPPSFKRVLSPKRVSFGKEATLQCFVEGDSPLKITWHKDGKLVQEKSSRFKIEVTNTATDSLSSLTIHTVAREDNANFECLAENKFGTNRSSGRLEVIEPPSAPQNFKAVGSESQMIELSWDASFDGNDPINKYIIQYKLESDTWAQVETMETANGKPTNAIVNRLQPATGYIFRLFAENSQGRSPASQFLRVTTIEDVPSGPPVNLHVEHVNMETFRVFWKAPEHHFWNGKIQGYYIGYKETNANDQYLFKTLMTNEPKADDLYVQIGGLKQFTKYSVVVLAYNSKGKGPQTEPLIVMTSEGAPTVSPSNVRCTTLTSETIHVTFDAPPSESINGILKGYKIFYKPVIEKWFEDVAEDLNITTKTSITITDLHKFMNYSIEVVAFTRTDSSPRSSVIYCKTLDDVPEAPKEIKVLVSSKNSVIVSWKSPENPNGVIKSYSVYWRDSSNPKEISSSKVMSQLNYHEVISLNQDRLYEFWITASTLLGEGQPSKILSQTPTGPNVMAKIVSFDDKIVASWKTNVELVCHAVGNPEPQRNWQLGGHAVIFNDKVKLSLDGTLILKDVQKDDAGDYTCHIQNDVGDDKITYTVIILSPPTVLPLEIISITSNAIELKWASPAIMISKTTGYTLKIKRNDGDWKEIPLPPEARKHKINNLVCGTQYEISMLAHNKIGSSELSEELVLSTNGSAPISPSKSDMINEASSSVSLFLNTWNNNGCPIEYYVVEYAPKSSNEWTLVSNSVKPEQRPLIITNLKMGTRYRLRMTAHNSAGSTVAKYEFATLTASGGTIMPEVQGDAPYGRVDSLMTQLNFYLVVPVICTAVILLAIMGVACMCIKLKQSDRRTREVNERLAAAALYELKRGDSSESFNYMQHGSVCRPPSSAKHGPSDITPYATLQLVNHGNYMSTLGRQCIGPPLPPQRFDGFSCDANNVIVSSEVFPVQPCPSFMPGDHSAIETTFIFPSNEIEECSGSALNSFSPDYQKESQVLN